MSSSLAELDLPGWEVRAREDRRTSSGFTLDLDSSRIELVVARCAAGRLRDAYPVSEHDIEVRLLGELSEDARRRLLTDIVATVESADPHCRRVVYAVPEGELTVLRVAEEAGFRYVVDVDLGDQSFSLMVAEPEWVTHVDMDLNHVPHT